MRDKAAPRGAYAKLNDLEIYYEVHGSGRPLILLPGSFYTIEAMGPLVPLLAETRQVIAVEPQGHGHTGDIARPLRFESLADDIAALITHLGLERADIFGYSLGGGVALQTAIRHPEVTRKLVVTSAPFSSAGWYPEDRAAQAAITAEMFEGTPLHDAFLRMSPTPDAWPVVVAKVRDLVTSNYDWSRRYRRSRRPRCWWLGMAMVCAPSTPWSSSVCLAAARRMVIWLACPRPRWRCCPPPHMSAGRHPSTAS